KGQLSLIFRMAICYFRRLIHILFLSKYNHIFIQRGATPFGPPVFEWIIRFVWRKSIVYDFDDAIWLNPEEKISSLKRFIKSNYKVRIICKWAEVVVVGNKYLAEYARQYSSNVHIIPTVVNTKRFKQLN